MENYNPRIYVADLSAYNDGRLVGEWIDLKKFNSGDEVMKEISSLLKKWSNQSGEVREEFAIHDYEDIPESLASEYMNKADFDAMYKMLKVSEEYNLPVKVLAKAMSEMGESDAEIVANQYIGSGESYDDYIIELVNEDISAYFKEDYFDTENYGGSERINASNEEEEEYGYDEMTDEEIGDFLIEVNGGYDELSDETKEMYFDYDRYGRDLSFDVEVIPFDSQVYIFNKNYAKGGYLRPSKDLKTTGEYLFKTNSGKEYRLNVSNFERVDETNDMLEIQDDLRQELGAIIIANSKWRILAKKGEVIKATTSTGIKGKLKKVNTFELGGQLKAFAVGGKVGSEITFNSWDDEKRMGTIQEVLDDGSYAVSVDTGMVLVYPSDVVEYNKPIERKKLFGIFANGGRTNERKHVNKSEDYEVRYAKNHPHRTGYKGNQKYANGGATDNNGSIDRYFSKLYFPNASASKSKNNISVYYKSSYNYDLSIDFNYNLDGDLKSAVIIHEIKEWEYDVSDATQIGGFENSQMYFDKLQEITTNVVNKNLSKIKTELEETNEKNYILSDVLEEALKHALKSVYIEWHNTEEFAKGGVTDEEYIEEYIDYFEDYDLAPPKVQKIMNEYEMKFIDGDNEDVKSALKEFSKIGYTFDVDLDNQPYDLRPIGTKGKSKMYE
jgi:antirestriction protein